MVESIQELRKICQKGVKEKDLWITCSIDRKISIYFTRLFLKLGFSANAVTGISFLFGLWGVVMFFFGYYILGFLCFELFYILDCSDGEIARYNKSSGSKGLFLERMAHIILEPLLFMSVAFNIYLATNNVASLIFGFLSAFACENGFRLVIWCYKVSYLEESTLSRELVPTGRISKIVQTLLIHGFMFAIVIFGYLGFALEVLMLHAIFSILVFIAVFIHIWRKTE